MTGGDEVHHPSMHWGKRQGKTSRETCNLRHSEVIVWKLSYNSKLCVKLRSSNCLWCQRCSVNGIQCLWQLLETEGCITSCQQMIFFSFCLPRRAVQISSVQNSTIYPKLFFRFTFPFLRFHLSLSFRLFCLTCSVCTVWMYVRTCLLFQLFPLSRTCFLF